jgi:AcrR family transcriptional regulator
MPFILYGLIHYRISVFTFSMTLVAGIRNILYFNIYINDFSKEWTYLEKCNRQQKGAGMAGKTKIHEDQIKHSRAWIFESLMILLNEKPYNKITVSDITEKAGVARQTFYHHYKNKDDVIIQFLESHLSPKHIEDKNIQDENKDDTLIITLPLNQIIRYAAAIKKILMSGAEYLIFKYALKWEDYYIGLYSDKLSGDEKIFLRYRIQFSSHGVNKILCDWIINDMPISIEKLKAWLCQFLNHPNSTIPTIILSIKN